MIFFRIILHPASHIWYSYIHNFIIITIIITITIIIIIIIIFIIIIIQ